MQRIMKTISVLVGLTVVACVFAADLQAREEGKSEYRMKPGRHAGRDRGMHGFVARSLHHLVAHAKELGLSDEQTNKIKTISQDFAKTEIQREAEWKTAEVDAQTLIHDEKSDLAAIEKAMRKVADAEIAMRLEGVKAFRAAKGVLTPEQQEKWRAMLRASHGEKAKKEGEEEEYEHDEKEKAEDKKG